MGDAISAAQKNAQEGFNRTVVQEALEGINVVVPKNVSGRQLIAFGQDTIEKKYNTLLPKLSIRDSTTFSGAIANILNGVDDDLDDEVDEYGTRWTTVVRDYNTNW